MGCIEVPEAKEGETLAIVYVPDDPGMSRTGMDRSIAILVGTGVYVLREGRRQATARSARLIRRAAPVAAAAAVLRQIAWLLGWQ